MKLPDKIIKLRKESGWSQEDFAEKLNVLRQAVSRWENGKSMPDVSIMLELCELLKINVNELLTGEHIVMDNYKSVAEKQLVELKTQEEKANKKVIYVVIVLLIMLVLSFLAGVNIGEDLGISIYNLTH